MNKNNKKAVSFILTLAMIVTMFAFAPATVYADTWDGSSSSTAWSGNGTANDPYIITQGAMLRGLAQSVNAGTSYAGVYFQLEDDINLDNHPWTPIGGGQGTYSYGDYCLPNAGNYQFAGYFNGNNHTISNLYINSITAGSGCTGVFGYLTGGIRNLTIDEGSINATSSAVFAVGGIAGYVTGCISNCHNINVDVTASNANSRYVGGIAGTVVNTSSSTPYTSLVDYCSNSGDINAPGRTGGIIGETARGYSASAVKVDQCCNTGSVTNDVSSGKVWSGGIVGYSMGSISNCYNRGTLANNGGKYSGGITGILYGYSGSIYGKMDNCYNCCTFGTGSDSSQDKQLYASADSSTNVVITASFWNPSGSSITQNTDSTWGTCHYVTSASATQLTDSTTITANYTYGDPGTATTGSIYFFLNRLFDGSTLGGKYAVDTNNINDGFPVLAWQNDPNFKVNTVGGGSASSTPVNTNTSPAIYLNGETGNDSNSGSSEATAVKSFAKAAELLNSTLSDANAIYITGTVTVDTTTSWALWATAPAIVRSYNYGGTLIEVEDGGSLTLSDITIDGNHDNIAGSTGRLINVEGGALIMNSGTVLEDNYNSSNGGAVRVYDGAFTMNGGAISDCISKSEGGGVAVYTSSSLSESIFTMNGGSITGCSTGQKGGGVEVGSYATFNITAGAISSNTAADGSGVYDEGTFNVGAGSTASAGAIYLPTGKTITLQGALDGSCGLLVYCQNPAADRVIATSASDGDQGKFTYYGGGYTFNFDEEAYTIVLLTE